MCSHPAVLQFESYRRRGGDRPGGDTAGRTSGLRNRPPGPHRIRRRGFIGSGHPRLNPWRRLSSGHGRRAPPTARGRGAHGGDLRYRRRPARVAEPRALVNPPGAAGSRGNDPYGRIVSLGSRGKSRGYAPVRARRPGPPVRRPGTARPVPRRHRPRSGHDPFGTPTLPGDRPTRRFVGRPVSRTTAPVVLVYRPGTLGRPGGCSPELPRVQARAVSPSPASAAAAARCASFISRAHSHS